jgi:hypothetical protein
VYAERALHFILHRMDVLILVDVSELHVQPPLSGAMSV